ncbi:hypothetical protein O7622_15620 [Micromonospora sp. WMMD1076]|uniref:hypothetical protein n=1 Tax=Micromonospora sp. WMMD1076 TaxID=3016103 RepID=UPI00249B64A7|nr:hypothetical protein [Micromonospora sp. WMMD1076]WFF04515.1 hypothetical protein O7622_15620 [Micromonospora sp. WMMD1076]
MRIDALSTRPPPHHPGASHARDTTDARTRAPPATTYGNPLYPYGAGLTGF